MLKTPAVAEHDWYEIASTAEIDSPALLVYPDRIRANVLLAIRMVGDVERLRPHVKTHKSSDITRLQMEAGIRKFKCATISEAAMLAACGAPDVLFAYPLCGPKLTRFLTLVRTYPDTQFSAIVDDQESALALSRAAECEAVLLDVYIDLNIGMNRTGIPPDSSALALYRYCAQMPQLRVKGFHAYDGHVKEEKLETRKAHCDRNFEPIAILRSTLQEEGFEKPVVIIGGSPSFPIYAGYEDVECSPGTFVLWDHGYSVSFPDQHFAVAAVLMTRVVSIPAQNRICVDLGHKAIASENPLEQRCAFLNAAGLTPVSQSEEHLVLSHNEGDRFRIGDVLYVIPTHICPTVAQYNKMLMISNRQKTQEWPVNARDR
ncbi:D-TA family PLP-dependent enzyme [Sphingobacterium suaedae]|uniref:D-TA family PLP-dependent enzyme n=1 Tax=Sphingobacterium suaedae TaxID=1686402 RepID=A0ABW5KCF0_9SPHI